MAANDYTPVSVDENEKYEEGYTSRSQKEGRLSVKSYVGLVAMAMICFAMGFGVGENWSSKSHLRPQNEVVPNEKGLLPPQSFIPEIPMKEVEFRFPTGYEDAGELGDELWNDLMPLGSGFLRVPYPRLYDMPPSKSIPGDHELAEMYSISIAHQLHCLGVLRHVIIKYEAHDKSRFAGAGHEYHCLDYIRQAVLCAGDTTLDHAQIVVDEKGNDRKSAFTGANSTHQCRDWNTIRRFLIDNRAGNKTGILI